MTDPIAILRGVYGLYLAIRETVDKMDSNRKELVFLSERCDALFIPLTEFQSRPDLLKGKEKVLANAEKLLSRILLLIQEPRFHKKTWEGKLLRCRFAYDDAVTLKDFSEKLTYLAGDLGVVLQLSATVELREIKDSRATSIKEALEIIGRQDLLTGHVSMEAIKAELDKVIQSTNSLGLVVTDQVDLSTSSIPSPTKPSSTSTKDTTFKVVVKANNEDVKTHITAVNFTRLEFDEETSEQLGQGSFGAVYACMYKNKPAALKQLSRTLGQVKDPTLLRALKKEALIMQCVSHPNIIEFLGASLERNILILELAIGSLDDVLYDSSWVPKGPIKAATVGPPVRSLEWKLDVVRDVANALRYLHVNNIIHRDIKPANVLFVLYDGKRMVAKICDFGISQAVDIAAATVGTKANEKPVGSTHYMAPELFSMQSIMYEASTDIYAFGVLVAELFVEERPWKGYPLGAIAHSVVNEDKRPLTDKWVPQGEQERAIFEMVGGAAHGCFAKACAGRPRAAAFVKMLLPKRQAQDVNVFAFFASPSTEPHISQTSQNVVDNDIPRLEMNERTEKMLGDLVIWFQNYCPDINRDILLTYAETLCVNKMTTIERLKRQLEQVDDKVAYLRSEISIRELDACDVVTAVDLNPSEMGPLLKALQPQGVQCIQSMLHANCPNISAKNVASLAAQLVNNNIVTSERFLKVLANNNFDFSFLSVHVLDWIDIKALTASPAISTDDATAVAVDNTVNESLPVWLHSHLPDTEISLVGEYLEDLRDANILTVARLATVFSSTDTQFAKQFQKELMTVRCRVFELWDPFDLADIRVGLTMSSPPLARPKGFKALLSWMRQATPNIAASMCGQYATYMDAAGVKTVNRLKNVLQTNKMFLTAIGINALDAADILVATQDYNVGQSVPSVTDDSETAQGELCLMDWLSTNVPSLFKSSIELYARSLVRSNVVTVNRFLTMVTADNNWLLSVLGEENSMDVADITAVVRSCSRFKVNDLVSVKTKIGRIFGVRYAEGLCHVEFVDGTADDSLRLVSATAVDRSAGVCLDNDTIRIAVATWFTSRRDAIAKYGHISSWNTSSVTDMSRLFLARIDFNEMLGEWDVSNVTTMASMFIGAASFNQPLNAWNVRHVVDMTKMFYTARSFCQSLARWNVGQVKHLESMLAGSNCTLNELPARWCTDAMVQEHKAMHMHRFTNDSLRNAVNLWCSNKESALCTYGPINRWNTSEVTTMNSLFKDQSNFDDSIANWNVGQVTEMSNMFENAALFNQPLHTWNVSKVRNMSCMFFKAAAFNNPVDGWNVSSVEDFTNMFAFASSFDTSTVRHWTVGAHVSVQRPVTDEFTNESLRDAVRLWVNNRGFAAEKYGEISTWNTSKVTNMTDLFRDNKGFNDPVGSWNVMNVTSMSRMFDGATSFNQPLNSWKVGRVTDMTGMFWRAKSFNQSIDDWDVMNVTSMANMFCGATAFNQSLGQWNTANVKNASNMFVFAQSFNIGNVGSWKTTLKPLNNNMQYEFSNQDLREAAQLWIMDRDSSADKYGDISTWSTAGVTDMSGLFKDCKDFNDPIGSWNVGSVKNMANLFRGAGSFNQPLTSWNVSSVTNMSSLFHSASAFNQPLASWDVSNVTDMSNLFNSATAFNQPLNAWNVGNVTNMNCMFGGAVRFNRPLNSWNVSNVTNMSAMFYHATAFNQRIDMWHFNSSVNRMKMLDGTAPPDGCCVVS
jgi:surface protein